MNLKAFLRCTMPQGLLACVHWASASERAKALEQLTHLAEVKDAKVFERLAVLADASTTTVRMHTCHVVAFAGVDRAMHCA